MRLLLSGRIRFSPQLHLLHVRFVDRCLSLVDKHALVLSNLIIHYQLFNLIHVNPLRDPP